MKLILSITRPLMASHNKDIASSLCKNEKPRWKEKKVKNCSEGKKKISASSTTQSFEKSGKLQNKALKKDIDIGSQSQRQFDIDK